VRDHLDGDGWNLLREVVEIESGKRANRPKLEEALALCRAVARGPAVDLNEKRAPQ
jgi:hypothetical protein